MMNTVDERVVEGKQKIDWAVSRMDFSIDCGRSFGKSAPFPGTKSG